MAQVIRAFLVTVLLCLPFSMVLSDEPSWTSNRGLFVASYSSELDPLQINKLHTWVLHLEDADGEAVLGAVIEADGGMPEHDHGLPTRPRVTEELGNGDYRVEGLRFHMGGKWQLTFAIEANDKTDTVVINITL
ncbi:MAG: FixH family protein [Woeseiaceae bacterium]